MKNKTYVVILAVLVLVLSIGSIGRSKKISDNRAINEAQTKVLDAQSRVILYLFEKVELQNSSTRPADVSDVTGSLTVLKKDLRHLNSEDDQN